MKKKLSLAIITALLLLILFLPSIASTSWGKQLIINELNKNIPGKAAVEEISLSWLGPQTVKGLLLRDPEGRPTVRLTRLSTDCTLFSLMRKQVFCENIELVDLSLDIKQEAHRPSNLQMALGRIPPERLLTNAQSISLLVTRVNARIDHPPSGNMLLGRISGETLENEKKGSFRANIQFNSIEAEASTFPTVLLDQFASLGTPSLEPLLAMLFGPTLDFSVKHTLDDKNNGLLITAESEKVVMNLSGQLVNNHFSLVQPGEINMEITPAIFNQILQRTGQFSFFSLEKPLKASIQLDKLALPLQTDSFPFSELELDAHIGIPSIAFKPWFENWGLTQNLGFDNVELDVATSPSATFISVKSKGSFKRNTQLIPFSFNSEIPKPKKMDEFLKTLQDHLKFGFSFRQVPMSQLDHLIGGAPFLEQVFGEKADISLEASSSDKEIVIHLLASSDKTRVPLQLSIKNDFDRDSLRAVHAAGLLEIYPLLSQQTIIGEKLQVEFSAALTPSQAQKGFCALKLTSPIFTGNTTLVWNGEFLSGPSGNPIAASFMITPQGFSVLRKSTIADQALAESLSLVKPMKLSLSSYPLSLLPQTSQEVRFSFSTDHPFAIHDAISGQTTHFRDFEGKLSGQPSFDALTFSLASHYQNTQTQEGDVHVEGRFAPARQRSGKLDFLHGAIDVKAVAHAIPAGLICNAFALLPTLGQQIEAVSGPYVDGTLHISLQNNHGLINTNLHSSKALLSFSGQLKAGTLYLKEPLYAEVEITKPFSRHILQAYAPLFSGAIRGDDKIKLTIDPQGFALQLQPLTLFSLQMSKASLQLGRIHFSNEGKLGKAVEMLNPPRASELAFWFTPLYFSYDHGLLRLSRLDVLLMNLYPMAAWGNIDFGSDRVEMTVGLSAEALTHAFHIPAIDTSYMLQLPLRGSLARAKIDKTKLTARLASLLASAAGGPEGLLFGTVASFATTMSEDSPPAPTTNPLPWSVGKTPPAATSQADGYKEKEHSSLKRIEKKADTFIRNFLKS